MRHWQVVRRLGPAAAALLLVVGCSSDDSGGAAAESAGATESTSAPSTVAPVNSGPATTPASTTPAATAAPPSAEPTEAPSEAPTTSAPDPAALLATALETLGDTYHFGGTVTLDGAPAAIAEGDRVGDGSRFDVTSNGSTVSYVVLPDGTWVRQGDGPWEALQDPPAEVDPIDALAAPDSVTLVSGDAGAAELDVAVQAAALGVSSDTPVVVRASVQGGALATVGYQTTQNGRTAQILTTFGPAADPSPVVAPA